RRAPSGGLGLRQHLGPGRPGCAVRRLQAIRDRSRDGPRESRRVPRDQDRVDQHGEESDRLSASRRRLTDDECRAAVRDALDPLPNEMLERLGDVAVIVDDRHPAGLMGIYDPTGGMRRIVIYREANPTVEEIRKTVLHEVGHFFGLDERRLRELGYG